MKAYIKPSLKVQNVVIESLMQTGSPAPELNEGPASGDGPVYTNDHRSSWGNLWGVED